MDHGSGLSSSLSDLFVEVLADSENLICLLRWPSSADSRGIFLLDVSFSLNEGHVYAQMRSFGTIEAIRNQSLSLLLKKCVMRLCRFLPGLKLLLRVYPS